LKDRGRPDNVPASGPLGEEPAGRHPASPPRRSYQARVAAGVALVLLSGLLYLAVPAVLFLPLSTGQKAGAVAALVVLAEVAFLVAALVLGREAVRRYRRFLNPRYWLEKKPR
jgi:hypothetical protein